MGSESDPPDPSPVSLIGNLFNAILDSCVVSYQKSTSNEQSRRLRSEAERFFLWGDGVSATGGQLDKALDTSSELYQTALSALYELGKVVHDGLTKVVALEGVAGPVAGSHELQLLLEDVSVTLDTSNAIEDSESLSDGENGPYSLEDVLDDMATYIDCLMDLSLALEDALAHPKSVRFKPTVIEPIVIEPTDIELNHVRPAVGDSVVSSHQGIDVPELSSPAYGDAISLGIDDSGLPSFQATMYDPYPSYWYQVLTRPLELYSTVLPRSA
ncbi:hypothetical protein N0V84_002369 [Fusarium piperis]|uniref:Uncharacterized protein n=1 Tax=Fusarium piperis TaxID=1435070 RepID=A0A9W8WJT1_9HYPO|nr:hypothetical protein N0V84_002369 [Fusarium piperis]